MEIILPRVWADCINYYSIILLIEISNLNWLNLYFINLIHWPFQSIWQLHPILMNPNWQWRISNDLQFYVTNHVTWFWLVSVVDKFGRLKLWYIEVIFRAYKSDYAFIGTMISDLLQAGVSTEIFRGILTQYVVDIGEFFKWMFERRFRVFELFNHLHVKCPKMTQSIKS